MPKAKSLKLKTPQKTLTDLKRRLANTRWPDEAEDAGWAYGTNLGYLKALLDYWHNGFDWRSQEAKLNNFHHFRVDIDGLGLHFIHEHGQGPSPMPLLLLHGWPDSFYRFYKVIPMLADPASYGGSPADAADVIVPSLPGFGFSDRTAKQPSFVVQTADQLKRPMTEVLGYKRFAVHGGDVGSGVTERLAHAYPDALIGIHMTDIPHGHIFSMPTETLSQAEQQYLKAGQVWGMTEGAYALVQSTKPQTLAYGLNDSPAGLAAWIVEKFSAWSDSGGNGNVERCFSKDELLTNVMIYWLTGTINSSFQYYFDNQHHPPPQDDPAPVGVPTGVALFPKDLVPAPRAFGERYFNIQRWTQMPRCGHFAALEEPELLVSDVREFFRPMRQ